MCIDGLPCQDFHHWQSLLARMMEKFELMALPYELRTMIIDIVTSASPDIKLPAGCFAFGKPLHIVREDARQLVRVGDRRLRLETILVSLSKTKLETWNDMMREKLDTYLSSIDFTPIEGDTNYRTGFDAVKRCKLNYSLNDFVPYLVINNPHRGAELASRFQYLRDLQIKLFAPGNVARKRRQKMHVKAVRCLWAELRLEAFSQLQNLESVSLMLGTNTFRFEAGSDCADIALPIFREIQACFQNGLRRRKGKQVKFEVTLE